MDERVLGVRRLLIDNFISKPDSSVEAFLARTVFDNKSEISFYYLCQYVSSSIKIDTKFNELPILLRYYFSQYLSKLSLTEKETNEVSRIFDTIQKESDKRHSESKQEVSTEKKEELSSTKTSKKKSK